MHEDDEDEDDDDAGFHSDDFNRSHRDPLDDLFRFGFSFGPGGMRFEEPQGFGHIFKEMEEIFAGLGQDSGHLRELDCGPISIHICFWYIQKLKFKKHPPLLTYLLTTVTLHCVFLKRFEGNLVLLFVAQVSHR